MHAAMQASVTNWGKLLIASGGALKPDKCFYHLISFDLKADGTWKYAKDEHMSHEFKLSVPLPNGDSAKIAVRSIVSSTSMAPPPTLVPSSFIEELQEWWDCSWIWDSLCLQGDEGWLAEAIADNSMMAITDGLFIRELYPNINLAAFVFVCAQRVEAS